MMRWITFGVIVIALSVGVTIGFPLLTGNGGKAESLIPDSVTTPSGPPPKMVVVGANRHEFGIMSQHEHGEKPFTLKNEGKGDLVIWKGPSTCSCTIANLSESESEKGKLTLKPGDSTTINVTWDTKEFSNKFERTVTIESNDPNNPKADFTISGLIYPPVTIIPTETTLNFMTPNNNKDTKLPIVLFSHDKPDMKVTGVVTSNPAVLGHSIRPINDEERKRFEIKEGGLRLDVIVKEGANLGPFNDEVLVKTDHPKKPELKFTAVGRVEGPIAMAPRWGIQMREVSAKKGGSQTLSMWVRDQSDTKFEIVKKPSILDVTIKPAEASAADSAPGAAPGASKGKKYEFVVTVKPQTDTGAVTDEILIKTSHPHAPLLRVPVSVFVNSNS